MTTKESKKKPEKTEKGEAPTARERTVDILAELQDMDEFEGLTVLDATRIENVPTQASGILSLDIILGGGPPPGIPLGRIIEVYGNEGGGKTTACMHMVAEAQKRGGVCAFIDVEHAVDPAYAKRIGVDFSTLLFRQPDSGEDALNTVEALVDRFQKGDLIVVDSVANLVPQAELDGEMGDQHVGLQSRMMSQALRKLTGKVSRRGVTVIFINQIRMKIGVTYGSPETTTGGRALKFYASQRIEVKSYNKIKKGEDEIIGQRVAFNVVKNKIAPPFRKAEVDLRYGEGFLRHFDVAHLAVGLKIITKAGAHYSYGEEKLGQGLDKVAEYLFARPDFQAKIEKEILAHYGCRA